MDTCQTSERIQAKAVPVKIAYLGLAEGWADTFSLWTISAELI